MSAVCVIATPRTSLAGAEVKTLSVEIGEHVLVGGTKSGVVAFIGPTQFAAGEWVGIELDSAVGKNDGSVNGVRYFTCKPLYGVFAKAAKLTKCVARAAAADDTPESGVASAATSQSSINVATENNNVAGKQPNIVSSSENVSSEVIAAQDSTVLESSSSDPPVLDAAAEPSNVPIVVSDPAAACDSTEMPPPVQTKRGAIPRPTHGSTVSLHRGSTIDLAATGDAAGKTAPAMKVGDRVLVSGNKVGTVRYVGATDFAKGEWVGVELDEPLGKNDGTVQGKR